MIQVIEPNLAVLGGRQISSSSTVTQLQHEKRVILPEPIDMTMDMTLQEKIF